MRVVCGGFRFVLELQAIIALDFVFCQRGHAIAFHHELFADGATRGMPEPQHSCVVRRLAPRGVAVHGDHGIDIIRFPIHSATGAHTAFPNCR